MSTYIDNRTPSDVINWLEERVHALQIALKLAENERDEAKADVAALEMRVQYLQENQ